MYFQSSFENARENGAIDPLLFSPAMHFVISPLTSVNHSPIMGEGAFTFCFIFDPISNIVILILMYKQTLPGELAVVEVPNVKH